MQTRSSTMPRMMPVEDRRPQQPEQVRPLPDMGPIEPDGLNTPSGLPRHLDHALQQRQAQEQRQMYGEAEPEAPAIDRAVRMYDYLWPVAFWVFAALNIVAVAQVVINMGNAYNVWNHANVMIISVASTAAMAIICQWVIKGPSGLPWRQPKIGTE